MDSSPENSTQKRSISAWLLAALLTAALLLRILPVNYGAPEPGYFAADEIDSVSRAIKMCQGDLMPIHFGKPTLYNSMLAVTYGGRFLFQHVFSGVTRAGFERAFFLQPFSFYLLARIISIAASAAALLLLLHLLQNASPSARMAALLILGAAPTSVWFGHVAKEDALATFCAFAAFAAALAAVKASASRAIWISFSLSCFFAGLAISTKYNCVFVLAFPFIAAFQMPFAHRSLLRAALLLAALSAAGYALGTPYAILHPITLIKGTLHSTVAAQITGSFNLLAYDANHGPAFVARIFWRELGIFILPVTAALIFLLFRRSPGAWLSAIPCALYLAMLLVSGQLDYQYVIVLTPILAWIAGTCIDNTSNVRLRRGLIALVAAGALLHTWGLVRQTCEYLGGDTRLVAAQQLPAYTEASHKPHKPLLIASGYYFHYYPAIAFDSETYRELLETSRQSGEEGGYFAHAEKYADEDPRPQYRTAFLPMMTRFNRTPEGQRVFLPQSISLNLADYAGRYSLVIVPESTFQILDAHAPELEPLNHFLCQIRSLPLVARVSPIPWKLAGPEVWIYKAP